MAGRCAEGADAAAVLPGAGTRGAGRRGRRARGERYVDVRLKLRLFYGVDDDLIRFLMADSGDPRAAAQRVGVLKRALRARGMESAEGVAPPCDDDFSLGDLLY